MGGKGTQNNFYEEGHIHYYDYTDDKVFGGIYLLVCLFIFVTLSYSLKKSIQEFPMWSRQPSTYYSPLIYSDNFWDYRHEGQLPYQLVVIKGEKTATMHSKNPHQNITVMQIGHMQFILLKFVGGSRPASLSCSSS